MAHRKPGDFDQRFRARVAALLRALERRREGELRRAGALHPWETGPPIVPARQRERARWLEPHRGHAPAHDAAFVYAAHDLLRRIMDDRERRGP